MTPKWAVQFAIEIGLDHAKFEGDNSYIVVALANSDTDLALHGNVIEDATISSNVTMAQILPCPTIRKLSSPYLTWPKKPPRN